MLEVKSFLSDVPYCAYVVKRKRLMNSKEYNLIEPAG